MQNKFAQMLTLLDFGGVSLVRVSVYTTILYVCRAQFTHCIYEIEEVLRQHTNNTIETHSHGVVHRRSIANPRNCQFWGCFFSCSQNINGTRATLARRSYCVHIHIYLNGAYFLSTQA